VWNGGGKKISLAVRRNFNIFAFGVNYAYTLYLTLTVHTDALSGQSRTYEH
jgi:hypothetical protein